jgi:hypothetical protein
MQAAQKQKRPRMASFAYAIESLEVITSWQPSLQRERQLQLEQL